MDFDLKNFTHRLIAESLFYDHETGAVGTLSLIDYDAKKERYLVSFMPEDGSYLIEEATEWEDEVELDEDSDVAYALAIDSAEYGSYEVPEVAAAALLQLAEEHNLLPSFTLLFEEDEMV